MSDLATTASKASELTTTATQSAAMTTGNKVALAIVVTVVTVGLGYVLYRVIAGYRAKKHARRIDLDLRDYDPLDFWEPIRFHKKSSLILSPDEFYILMTKEAIAVPPDYAAEMLPYDTRAGEFRVHYAGFFDPGFGWNASTGKAGSSRGVLEVRSHEVPFLLEHGQTVGFSVSDTLMVPDVALDASATIHTDSQHSRIAFRTKRQRSSLQGKAR